MNRSMEIYADVQQLIKEQKKYNICKMDKQDYQERRRKNKSSEDEDIEQLQIEEEQTQNEELQLESYIHDPHQYLDFCIKDKKIKVMDECNPIMSNVYLKDISLHKKGPLEDKIYSKNNFYYSNIRRGNTLCQIFNQEQKQQDLFICRRGMKKFYDLQPEYLKVNRKLTHQNQRFRRRIFQKVDKAIEKGTKINLYALFKENGQHCQISYIQKIQYWLFASKNVAILAKDEDDLKNHYHKERFYWAKIIGLDFFRILSRFSQEEKLEFIKDIEGKTLLGQHCGKQEHQHITKYKEVEIIFYGIVENYGEDHCLPVTECEQFLSKFGLKMSKMEKVEGLRQKNKVYFNMYKLLKKIGQGSMDQCGEGSVLYIVAENENSQKRTVGMCKLKTCEYLIFRKMREMIKINFAKKGVTANNFEKFKFEINSLCDSYFKPPKPLQYYFRIGQQAFKQIRKNQKDLSDNQLRYKFVNFLENVEKMMEESREKMEKNSNQGQKQAQNRRFIVISPPLLNEQYAQIEKICKKGSIAIQYSYRQGGNQTLNKSIINLVHMVPRINYDQLSSNTSVIVYQPQKNHHARVVEQLKEYKDLKKSHLISFLKIEDKKKAIDLLSEKIYNFEVSCREYTLNSKEKQKFKHYNFEQFHQITNLLQNKELELPEEKKPLQHQNDTKVEGSVIYVIVTLLMPGSGKSSLAQCIQNQFFENKVQVISSDKIRQIVIEKYKSKRKGDKIDSDIAFTQTKKKGLQKYQEAVKAAIGDFPPEDNKILYIDRVFCPTSIVENILELRKPWTKFIIVTHIRSETKLNEYIYPHSLTYLLGCMKRCLQRQDHETLSTNPQTIAKVILKFYQMYRGFNYKRVCRQLEEEQIQYQFVELEFMKQENEIDNKFLKKKVEQCLKGIPPGHDAPQSNLYIELIQLMYKYSEHIVRKPSEQAQEERRKELIQNAEKLLRHCK